MAEVLLKFWFGPQTPRKFRNPQAEIIEPTVRVYRFAFLEAPLADCTAIWVGEEGLMLHKTTHILSQYLRAWIQLLANTLEAYPGNYPGAALFVEIVTLQGEPTEPTEAQVDTFTRLLKQIALRAATQGGKSK